MKGERCVYYNTLLCQENECEACYIHLVEMQGGRKKNKNGKEE